MCFSLDCSSCGLGEHIWIPMRDRAVGAIDDHFIGSGWIVETESGRIYCSIRCLGRQARYDSIGIPISIKTAVEIYGDEEPRPNLLQRIWDRIIGGPK